MSTLEIRKETTQDKILTIFQGHPGQHLMGETVVFEFEDRFGRNGTSDTVRTGISALTRKGYLLETEEVISPTTQEPVKTWVLNEGPIVELPEGAVKKVSTQKQLQTELAVLQARYKNEQESNAKLYGIIERLREENEQLKKENTRLEGELSAEHMNQAGVDL